MPATRARHGKAMRSQNEKLSNVTNRHANSNGKIASMAGRCFILRSLRVATARFMSLGDTAPPGCGSRMGGRIIYFTMRYRVVFCYCWNVILLEPSLCCGCFFSLVSLFDAHTVSIWLVYIVFLPVVVSVNF